MSELAIGAVLVGLPPGQRRTCFPVYVGNILWEADGRYRIQGLDAAGEVIERTLPGHQDVQVAVNQRERGPYRVTYPRGAARVPLPRSGTDWGEG